MDKNKIYDIGKVLSLIVCGLIAKSLLGSSEYIQCIDPLTIGLVGGGIVSSLIGGKKAKAQAPPAPTNPLDLAQGSSEKLLGYYQSQVPEWIQLQEQLGPQLMSQMFGQTQQFLGGVGGQPGFQALQRTAGLQAGQTMADLRAVELAQQTGQTGLTRGLMEALSPEQAAAVRASAQEAERARAAAQGVSPQEKRAYEQQARESFQAAGRLGGNAAVAAEIMGRENVLAAKRAEAAQAGQQAYALAGGFYTNPGLQALRSAPLSYTAGQQDLSTALSLGPAASGQFDYNAPLGFAQQAGKAQNQYNQDVYNTNLANQQAKAKMYSSIGSTLMGAGLGGMGGPSGSNFSSFLGGGDFGNAGTAFGNMFRGSAGQPLKAYTV